MNSTLSQSKIRSDSLDPERELHDSLLCALGKSYQQFIRTLDDDDLRDSELSAESVTPETLKPYTGIEKPNTVPKRSSVDKRFLDAIDAESESKESSIFSIWSLFFCIVLLLFSAVILYALLYDKKLLFNREINPRNVPIFLDINYKSSFIPSALSECLSVAVSLSKDIQQKENKKIGLILTDSLCQVDLDDESIKVLLINRNPILRVVLSFIEQKNPRSPYYDKRLVGMNFGDYANSSFQEPNLLTRRLLCINDGRELNGIDFLRAKSLLRRDAFYLFRDHKTAFHKLHYLLLSNSSSYKIEKCFDMHFRKKQSKQFHEFFFNLEKFKKYFSKLQRANNYDMQLYNVPEMNFTRS